MIGSARLSGLLLAQSAECFRGGVALVTAPCSNRHHGNRVQSAQHLEGKDFTLQDLSYHLL